MSEVWKDFEERLPTQQVERLTTSDGRLPPLTITMPTEDDSNRVASTGFVQALLRRQPWSQLAAMAPQGELGELRPRAEGANAIAFGLGALARLYGQMAWAGGAFAQRGDAQVAFYQMRATTNNAIQTSLSLDGQSGSVPNAPLLVAEDSVLFFNVYVAALAGGGLQQAAAFHYEGAVRHVDGTIAFVEQPRLVSVFKDVPTWDVRLQVERITKALAVVVQGEASKLIRWLGFVQTVEVKF